MDAIKWIKSDLERPRNYGQGMRTLFLIIILILPACLGIALRDGLSGVFVPRVFIPNIIAATALALAFRAAYKNNFNSRQSFIFGFVLLILCGFLANGRAFFPVGERTVYHSTSLFWSENLGCFTKGGIMTLVMGIYLSAISFVTSSWPNRRWRAYLAAVSGMSGMIMLGFHCDSSSLGHVFFGHFGQGLILGVVVFLLQEILFRLQVRRALPDLMKKIKNGGKLD
jgi:hypothetical protein